MTNEELINRERNKSAKELMTNLGIDHTPTVEEIINYLEKKSEISIDGRMSTYNYINKEALRLAAVYLQDAYYER